MIQLSHDVKSKYGNLERARVILTKSISTEENDKFVHQNSKGKIGNMQEKAKVVQRKNKEETEDIERIQKLDELIKTLWPEEKKEDFQPKEVKPAMYKSPIASHMIGGKLESKVLKLLKKAQGSKAVRRGAPDVTKLLRKGNIL